METGMMLWWEETESEELTSKAVVRSGSCFPSICLSLGGGEVYCTESSGSKLSKAYFASHLYQNLLANAC
eukprot:2206607-Rhodomonas_salina.3